MLRLDRSRYEVRALSLSSGSAVYRLRRLGISVDIIDEPDDESAIRELTAYLRRDEIDLVHAHMYRAEVVGTRAAIAARTPVIMATVHSSRNRSEADMQTLAELTPRMDGLIVPSESIRSKVVREGRVGAEFAIIPNGVDLSRFSGSVPPYALRSEFGIPRDAFLAGVIARLEPEKGHAHLIDAWRAVVEAVPNAWLAIVGEGSQANALRRRAANVPQVVFTGRRDDISALTADLSVAVLPSLREAQGISILEAMARCRPVIASAVGGIPEVITSGVDGLLVPPESPPDLAAAIIRLARSPSLRERLGAAGRATVVARFSIDAQVRRIQEVYDEELLRAGVLPGAVGAGSADSGPGSAVPSDRGALEMPPV